MSDIIEIHGEAVRAHRTQAAVAHAGERMAGRRPEGMSAPYGLFLTLFGPVANQIVRLTQLPQNNLAAVMGAWRAEEKEARDGAGDAMFSERTLAIVERAAPLSASGHGFYELRTYDLEVGRGHELVQLLAANIHARERYSPNFGFWTALTGRSERLITLWGYRDFEHRAKAQEGARKDAEWGVYRETALPLINAMTVSIMTPLAGSALA